MSSTTWWLASRRAAFSWRGLSFALALLLLLLGESAQGREPTADEQLMLEMINRMRTRPQQELDLLANINYGAAATFASPSSDDPNVAAALTFFNVRPDILSTQWAALTPVQPLAWNGQLGVSSATYSQVMIDVDQQGHNLDAHGDDLAARLIASNYLFVGGGTAGENVFAFARSVFHGHAAFAIDWGATASGIQVPPGHRDLIANGDMREIGIGILNDSDSATAVGPLVMTQHFAVDYTTDAFLTGVAFADANGDAFYAPGEGLSGLAIVAVDTSSGNRFSTLTWGSGGYTLELAPGTYDVVASGPSVGQLTFPGIVVNSQNIKLDVMPSSTPLPGDANMDGVVDRADAALLSQHLGIESGALWGGGDFDGNGFVDLQDLAILSRNLSPASSSVPSAAAVPEAPAGSLTLLAAFTLVGVGIARRR
ncbi:MAG: hypothetical protein DCC68_03165 [Planctomycetota bacterium]|nr:MAG: hypothetical protein DCC68_03165 [Planctomycetota bacterium]